MWTLWRQRNRGIFEDTELSTTQLPRVFIQFLFDWSCAWDFTNSNSIPEFIESLHNTSSL
jgi:hypothetical protein